MYTPWGNSDGRTKRTEGIVFHTTPSHGGFRLDDQRLAEFKAQFPDFKTWCGEDRWFEEDQDWSMVALAFPEFFSDEEIYAAIWTVNVSRSLDSKAQKDYESMKPYDRQWAKVIDWLQNTSAGQAVQARADAFHQSHLQHWKAGSSSTSGYGWTVWLRRVGDRAERRVKFAEYPAQTYYTDAELDALGVADV